MDPIQQYNQRHDDGTGMWACIPASVTGSTQVCTGYGSLQVEDRAYLTPLKCGPVCAIIGGDAVLAQDRPGFDFDQLTWADHNCRIYEVPAAPMHSIWR